MAKIFSVFLMFMDINIWTYLIVCPLCMLGGFVDSIAGGGGLITLPAYLAAGLPSHTAIGTNKISSAIGTSVSFIKYVRQGFIELKIGFVGACLAILGSFIGSNLVLYVDAYILKIVLIILLPVTAIFVIWDKGIIKEREDLSFLKTLIVTSIVAFVIGMYDGFYGPGTGTFIIILLSLFAHMGIEKSNGISKTINLGSNVCAVMVFIINGVPIILLGLVAGLFNAVGNYFGSKLFINKGIKIVRPIMIVVLVLLLIKIIFDTFI